MPMPTKDIPALTFRVQFTIEVVALDYIEAADHQKRAEVLFETVRAEYGAATFIFRQLRPHTRPRTTKRRRRSALAVYDDL